MLANRIKELREKADLTQTQLAAQIGIGITAMNNYENGHRMPTADIVMRFADYFHVSCDYLLNYHSPVDFGTKDKLLETYIKLSPSIKAGINKALGELILFASALAPIFQQDADSLFETLLEELSAAISWQAEVITSQEEADLSIVLLKVAKKYATMAAKMIDKLPTMQIEKKNADQMKLQISMFDEE